MDNGEEHSSLLGITAELDFDIDPASTSQNYTYDPEFELFSNSIISEVEPSGPIDPIFLQSNEVFSNFDEDSVQDFVEGFGEAPECAATSSFTMPPAHISTQNHPLIHYSDNFPVPSYITALPVKGSSVQTSTVNNANTIHNKENQQNYSTTSIAIPSNHASHTYYTETLQNESPVTSPTTQTKSGRYGASRTPYRCGKCGQPKKGHQCSNEDGEPARKSTKKRALVTSNTSSPASSEPHTPNTPIFQDANLNYWTDYKTIIQQHNSRNANNTTHDNGGNMSPVSPLPNSPAPTSLESSQTRLTPITKSFVIQPKSKALKMSENTTVHTNSPRGFVKPVVTARN